MSGQEVKGHGFVLRIVPAQEADIIVRILTKDGEKISAFAKAGLKSRKRFGGALEPLTQIDFRATKKDHQDLLFLEETQVKHEFRNLRSDFERLMAASYISELTEFGAQDGLENSEIYNLIGAAWRALDIGLKSSCVVRQFEVKLLSLLGWLPSFAALDSNVYSQAPIKGSDQTQNVILKLLSTSILNQNLFSEEDVRQVGKVTHSLFQEHLGGNKLKADQFLGSLQRFQK